MAKEALTKSLTAAYGKSGWGLGVSGGGLFPTAAYIKELELFTLSRLGSIPIDRACSWTRYNTKMLLGHSIDVKTEAGSNFNLMLCIQFFFIFLV